MLRIALNPKSKLTLELGTNLINRNTVLDRVKVCITDTHNRANVSYMLNVVSESRSWDYRVGLIIIVTVL